VAGAACRLSVTPHHGPAPSRPAGAYLDPSRRRSGRRRGRCQLLAGMALRPDHRRRGRHTRHDLPVQDRLAHPGCSEGRIRSAPDQAPAAVRAAVGLSGAALPADPWHRVDHRPPSRRSGRGVCGRFRALGSPTAGAHGGQQLGGRAGAVSRAVQPEGTAGPRPLGSRAGNPSAEPRDAAAGHCAPDHGHLRADRAVDGRQAARRRRVLRAICDQVLHQPDPGQGRDGHELATGGRDRCRGGACPAARLSAFRQTTARGAGNRGTAAADGAGTPSGPVPRCPPS
jgi:hypothetical protein